MSKWKPNEEQLSIIEELIGLEKKEKSASDFVRRYLPFSLSRWTRIKAVIDPAAEDSYFDAVRDPESVMAELEDVLREIRLQEATSHRIIEQPYVLKQFKSVAQAVRECRQKPSPERLVKYLAPTGGGKSMLCEYLADTFHAAVVETREAWRKSYMVVLMDIARACRIRVVNDNWPTRIEDKLVISLSQQNRVLVLDEAEFFGASALNGLKLLLNKTRVSLVLCAVPEAHDNWNRRCPMEADQIARRTHAIIQCSIIDPADAEHFFAADQFEDRTESIKHICAEASLFGHYSFLRRMALVLQGTRKADAADVSTAMKRVRLQMQRESAAPNLPGKR